MNELKSKESHEEDEDNLEKKKKNDSELFEEVKRLYFYNVLNWVSTKNKNNNILLENDPLNSCSGCCICDDKYNQTDHFAICQKECCICHGGSIFCEYDYGGENNCWNNDRRCCNCAGLYYHFQYENCFDDKRKKCCCLCKSAFDKEFKCSGCCLCEKPKKYMDRCKNCCLCVDFEDEDECISDEYFKNEIENAIKYFNEIIKVRLNLRDKILKNMVFKSRKVVKDNINDKEEEYHNVEINFLSFDNSKKFQTLEIKFYRDLTAPSYDEFNSFRIINKTDNIILYDGFGYKASGYCGNKNLIINLKGYKMFLQQFGIKEMFNWKFQNFTDMMLRIVTFGEKIFYWLTEDGDTFLNIGFDWKDCKDKNVDDEVFFINRHKEIQRYFFNYKKDYQFRVKMRSFSPKYLLDSKHSGLRKYYKIVFAKPENYFGMKLKSLSNDEERSLINNDFFSPYYGIFKSCSIPIEIFLFEPVYQMKDSVTMFDNVLHHYETTGKYLVHTGSKKRQLLMYLYSCNDSGFSSYLLIWQLFTNYYQINQSSVLKNAGKNEKRYYFNINVESGIGISFEEFFKLLDCLKLIEENGKIFYRLIFKKKYCNYCLISKRSMKIMQKKKLKRCSRCKKVNYCCDICQKIDWKNHKKSCKCK